METQICNNYEKSDTYNFIIIINIIYIIFISVIIFIKQPIIIVVILEVPEEVPEEVPKEVSKEVYEKRAFIAIQKYGDAYVKLKALGDISSHNYWYPSNVWIIDSHERNDLLNKNVSISKVIAIYMQPIDITLLKIYFVKNN